MTLTTCTRLFAAIARRSEQQTPRRTRSRRFRPESLEPRSLLTLAITELTIPVNNASAREITNGPDGNVWVLTNFLDGNNLIRLETSTGKATKFPLATTAHFLKGLTADPNGTLWFLEDGEKLARFTISTASVTEFPLLETEYGTDLILGPDNNIWMTASNGAPPIPQVDKIDPATGQITRYTISNQTTSVVPSGLAVGPDQALYFAINNTTMGRVTMGGAITKVTVATVGAFAFSPDGSLWVADYFGNQVLRVNRSTGSTIKAFHLAAGSSPESVTYAAGAMWATENGTNKLARIDLSTDTVTEYVLPSTQSDRVIPEAPRDIITAPDGNLWYDQETGFSRVGVVQLGAAAPTGGFKTTEGGLVPEQLSAPPKIVSASILKIRIGGTKANPKTRFAGFKLVFSQPVDAASGSNTSTYVLTAAVSKGGKLISQRVAFHVTLDASGTTASVLLNKSTNPFTKGGKLIVTTNLVGSSGFNMGAQRSYTITAMAKSIR